MHLQPRLLLLSKAVIVDGITQSHTCVLAPFPCLPAKEQSNDLCCTTFRNSRANLFSESGYEALAQREYEKSAALSKENYSHFGSAVGGYSHATDPVYKSGEDIHKYPNVGGDWQALMQQRQQAMENQYGAYQHFQYNGDGVAVVGYQGEDEEML